VSWIPQVGDTNVEGALVVATPSGCGGIVIADAIQGVADSQWGGQSNEPNPLVFGFSGGIVVDDVDIEPAPKTRVKFDIVAAEFAPVATNVRLL
jgi:hypothetical protein